MECSDGNAGAGCWSMFDLENMDVMALLFPELGFSVAGTLCLPVCTLESSFFFMEF